MSQHQAPAWSLDVPSTERGVDLVITVGPEALVGLLRISLDRTEARVLARAILAAAGDATERTFKPDRGNG